MKQSERMALTFGALVGMATIVVLRTQVRMLREISTDLKKDNILLLTQTVRILNSIEDPDQVIPADITTDMRFRYMAFMAEFDQIYEEPNEGDTDG